MKKFLLCSVCLFIALLACSGSASDRTAKTPELKDALEIKLTGKYIIFPVSNKGKRGRMTIVVGDQLVHNLDCDFPADTDSVDWWSYLDMQEYKGKTAKIAAAFSSVWR